MKVKARKVGNSIVLTVPNEVAEELAIYNGREFEVESRMGILEYRPTRERKTLNWGKYVSKDTNYWKKVDPQEYVDGMRDDDR